MQTILGANGVIGRDLSVRLGGPFEQEARGLLTAGDHKLLVDYESLGREALLSISTPDHYLPLLYVIGTRQASDSISFPVEGVDGSSISMLSVRVGEVKKMSAHCEDESASSSAARAFESSIRDVLPDLERVYTDIHAHPELSMQETRTAGIAADWLRAAGFEVTPGVGTTGVVGMLRNIDGPTIMLRADMDALPVREETGLPYARLDQTAVSDRARLEGLSQFPFSSRRACQQTIGTTGHVESDMREGMVCAMRFQTARK